MQFLYRCRRRHWHMPHEVILTGTALYAKLTTPSLMQCSSKKCRLPASSTEQEQEWAACFVSASLQTTSAWQYAKGSCTHEILRCVTDPFGFVLAYDVLIKHSHQLPGGGDGPIPHDFEAVGTLTVGTAKVWHCTQGLCLQTTWPTTGLQMLQAQMQHGHRLFQAPKIQGIMRSYEHLDRKMQK